MTFGIWAAWHNAKGREGPGLTGSVLSVVMSVSIELIWLGSHVGSCALTLRAGREE